MMCNTNPHKGFSLIELLIALAMGATLTTAVMQLVIATASSYRLQQNLGAMQENARYAFNTMRREIEAAGYTHTPWVPATVISAIGNNSADAVSTSGDRLILHRWSDRNCFGNPNVLLDAGGKPLLFLREVSFSRNSGGNLALSCRYGPDAGHFITQVNRLGLVQDVEAFQVMYAEDSDADGNADRWVHAGEWLDESGLMAVRLALLLATPEPMEPPEAGTEQVLDELINTPADGRLRKVFSSAFVIQGRRQ